MARFPCDQHGSHYAGRQRTAYPAIVNGSMTMRERRRLCADCFATLHAWCASWMAGPDDDSEPRCLSLGCTADMPYAVFVTLYPDGDERRDYYGRLCRVHLDDGAMALFGHQPGLPAPF